MSTNDSSTQASIDRNHAPLWTYGEVAAQRAEEQSRTCECGDELCWDCFKEDLEHFDVGESNDE